MQQRYANWSYAATAKYYDGKTKTVVPVRLKRLASPGGEVRWYWVAFAGYRVHPDHVGYGAAHSALGHATYRPGVYLFDVQPVPRYQRPHFQHIADLWAYLSRPKPLVNS